jgi:hypothetical protein
MGMSCRPPEDPLGAVSIWVMWDLIQESFWHAVPPLVIGAYAVLQNHLLQSRKPVVRRRGVLLGAMVLTLLVNGLWLGYAFCLVPWLTGDPSGLDAWWLTGFAVTTVLAGWTWVRLVRAVSRH